MQTLLAMLAERTLRTHTVHGKRDQEGIKRRKPALREHPQASSKSTMVPLQSQQRIGDLQFLLSFSELRIEHTFYFLKESHDLQEQAFYGLNSFLLISSMRRMAASADGN